MFPTSLAYPMHANTHVDNYNYIAITIASYSTNSYLVNENFVELLHGELLGFAKFCHPDFNKVSYDIVKI